MVSKGNLALTQTTHWGLSNRFSPFELTSIHLYHTQTTDFFWNTSLTTSVVMGSAMRELKVEDALLYLDQVKVEFGDQPHIYNEFLDIMKTFKTQQIDTPGVIQRVSNLFRGNRRLVLGFNTFLPEGYKIELPEGDGPAVAVYRAPGSNVTHILTDSNSGPQRPPVPAQMRAQQPPMRQGLPPVGQRGAREPPYQSISGGPQASKLRGPGVQSQHDGPQQRALHVMDQQQGRQGPGAIMSRQAPMPSLSAVSDSNDMKMRINGPSLSMSNDFSGGKPVPRSLSPPLPSIQQQQAQPPLSQASQQPPAGATAPPSQQGPLEFDHAINYVTTIKKRFASEPYTYKKFLEILHTYQKEQRGIKEVLDEVSTLFADHPDLLKEFTYFLPDAVQAQAKVQLEQVAKEAEARNALKAKKSAAASQAQQPRQSPSSAAAARAGPAPRASAAAAAPQSLPPEYDRAGSAIVPVGFSGSHGRSPEHENSIIRGAHFGIVSFSPVRPPRKSDLTPAQAAIQKGRPTAIPPLPMSPNTAETSFFQRAKEHLNRRELASDKPTGSKRHTPFTEFLKCLHLFGAGILNKEELVLLLKGLFMQGHAPKSGANASGGNFNPSVAQDANELLREFEEILIGRGPYAQQEAEFKDKSKYGALRTKDFDFTGCEHPTPSYRTYPCDYPQSLFNSHPGQSEMEAAVLNSNVVCVGTKNGSFRTIEDCNGSKRRHNIYEEAMFQIEDERFEVDMAIERNAQAMGQIEPFAEEVQALREQEEKDGQPIGRLQYQLNRYAMNTIHINAIGRVYGERGDEVLQHLVENPYIVLPIIYQRLKQKDTEWKKVKAGLLPKWRSLVEENYEGTLDALCYFKRLDVERMFNSKVLLDECKRAQTYAKHPERRKVNRTTQPFIPNFRLINTDPGAFLCQPHVLVHCPVTSSHRDAMQLVSHHVRLLTAARPLDRERISRIWAEFIVPWFSYPAHWVVNQVRPSFGDTFGPYIVKCKSVD